MIEAVIFDMDGLLINSEPFWQKVEMEVFGSFGLKLTEDHCLQTVGLRLDEVIDYWHKKLPWGNEPSKEWIFNEIIQKMEAVISTEIEAMPGVFDCMQFFADRGIPMAIASSSYFVLIYAAIKRLGIEDQIQVVHSAEVEAFGKPHPAVFIETAKLLGISPEKCLVFEDSLNGVLAGKSARMKTIAVPERMKDAFFIADRILNSLEDFNESVWLEINAID